GPRTLLVADDDFDDELLALLRSKVDVTTWLLDIGGAVSLVRPRKDREFRPYVFFGLGSVAYDLDGPVGLFLPSFVELGGVPGRLGLDPDGNLIIVTDGSPPRSASAPTCASRWARARSACASSSRTTSPAPRSTCASPGSSTTSTSPAGTSTTSASTSAPSTTFGSASGSSSARPCAAGRRSRSRPAAAPLRRGGRATNGGALMRRPYGARGASARRQRRRAPAEQERGAPGSGSPVRLGPPVPLCGLASLQVGR